MRISDIADPTVPYFRGNFAPVQSQLNEPCIEVMGTVPDALNGAFLRIGANPVFVNNPDSYHPFAGDGMIHEVVFEHGKASYRNRFVETEGHLAEQKVGGLIWDGINTKPEDIEQYGPSKNIANPSMILLFCSEYIILKNGKTALKVSQKPLSVNI